MTVTRDYASLWTSLPAHSLDSPKLCSNSNHAIFSVFEKNLREDPRLPPFYVTQLLVFISFTPEKGGYTVRQTEELTQLIAILSKSAFSQISSFISLTVSHKKHTRTSSSHKRVWEHPCQWQYRVLFRWKWWCNHRLHTC